jgi:hypothetical protein
MISAMTRSGSIDIWPHSCELDVFARLLSPYQLSEGQHRRIETTFHSFSFFFSSSEPSHN